MKGNRKTLSGLKGVQPPLPFGERTRDCSPGHAEKEGPQLARTGVFLPGESQGRGSLVGCRHGVTESDTTGATQQQHSNIYLVSRSSYTHTVNGFANAWQVCLLSLEWNIVVDIFNFLKNYLPYQTRLDLKCGFVPKLFWKETNLKIEVRPRLQKSIDFFHQNLHIK